MKDFQVVKNRGKEISSGYPEPVFSHSVVFIDPCKTQADSGRPLVYKLGQKIRLDAPPRTIAHTTLYLSEAEFDILSTLPATTLEKTRRLLTIDGLAVGIAEFGGQLSGLLLVEVDLGAEGALPFSIPRMSAAEVTDDERFTGGALANTSSEELIGLLSEYRN